MHEIELSVAGVTVCLPQGLAELLGYTTHTDGDGSWRPTNGSLCLIEALSEGLTGAAAGMRAVALREQRRVAAVATHDEQRAAEMRLHAAIVERQTAALRALAAGIAQARVDRLLEDR